MKIKEFLIVIILLVFIGGGIGFMVYSGNQPDKLDSFASCLKEKKATFFGAFWCPHCQTQKTMFGRSERLLPYVECSTPDGNAQTKICIDNKIKSYPTWEFADGSRETGEVPLQKLAEKTGCELPK